MSKTQTRYLQLRMTAVLALLSGLLVVTAVIQDTSTVLPKPSIFQHGSAFLERYFALYCSVSSKETSTLVFIWYKGEARVKIQRSSVLEFPSLTEADQGVYTCQASDGNPYTTSPTSDPVTLYPVDATDDRIEVAKRRERRQKRSDRLPTPTIFQRDSPISGRPFALECVLYENSDISRTTRFSWFKDDVEIKGRKIMFLEFPSLQEEDGGVYVCSASDEAADSTSGPSLPYYLSALVPPVVHIDPSTPNSVVKGRLGKELTLTCNVTKAVPGVPDNGYSWSYLPSPEDLPRPLEGSGKTVTLGPLTRQDSGRYFCTARSDQHFHKQQGFTGHASVTVEVIYLENISLISHAEVNEGEDLTLTCKVDSHPPAQIFWIVKGKLVRRVRGNLDHYVIVNASCADSGHFTCGASNTDLPDLEVKVTEQVHVHCDKDDIPGPKIKTSEDKGRKEPDRDMTNILIALVVVLAVVCIAVVMLFCRGRVKLLRERYGRWLASLGTTRRPRKHKNSGSAEDVESGSDTVVELLPRDQERRGLRRRKKKRKGQPEKGHKFKLESPQITLLEGQRVQFDETYKNGIVHVFPPLQENPTPQSAEQGTVVVQEEDREKKKQEEAKTSVIKLLHEQLKEITRPEDPPSFVFTQAMSDTMSIIICHKAKGVLIVHVDGTTDPEDTSTFEKAKNLLEESRDSTTKKLQSWLEPSAITLLLALPNVTDVRASSQTLKDSDVQVLRGRRAADYKEWLLDLHPHQNPPWKPRLGNQSFIKAVSSFLCVECCRDSTTWTELPPDHPSGWLLTREQAAILHRADRLLHLWGPPGSGKTMLLVDRARQWLQEGKNVIVAVASPKLELLLDILGRWALHGTTCDKAHNLKLCRDAGKFQQAVDDWEQEAEDTCAVLDEAEEGFLDVALRSLKEKKISFLWTARREDLTKTEAEGFERMNGQRVLLEHSIQCSREVVELAHVLEEGLPPPAIAVHPAAQNLGTQAIQAVRHVSHASNTTFGPRTSRFGRLGSLVNRLFSRFSADFACTDCEDWLRSSVSPLVSKLSREDEQWRRWVVLLTGDWGSDTTLTGRLVAWLRRHGVPAVLEWQPDNETSNLDVPSLLDLESDQKSGAHSERAATRARVAVSEDEQGAPAVHVIHACYFRGLDKPYVLVVHYDWRDDHPDHQSQDRQESRLTQHREQLFRAVTHCQQELAVCFLSPSPAAALLPQLHQGT